MDQRQHKFAREQRVEVQDAEFPVVVEIVALLPECCEAHGAPFYGCVHSGDHFTICEEALKPLTSTSRRKMN